MKKVKKAQMEIVGIAIVAILLIVGIGFVIRFMFSKEPLDHKRQFSDAEIASNTIHAFLESNSRDCNYLTMAELLQDCASAQERRCSNGTSNSCEYVQKAAQEIFGQTLDSWNLAYEFLAYQEESLPMIHLGEPCPKDKKSKIYNLPSTSGTIFSRLDICDTPKAPAKGQQAQPPAAPVVLVPDAEPDSIFEPIVQDEPTPAIETPSSSNTTACTCALWKEQGCGGSCGWAEMHRTRSCNPKACRIESQCVSHPTCTPAAPENTPPTLTFPKEIALAQQLNPLPPTIPKLSLYAKDKEMPSSSLTYRIKSQDKQIANCWIDNDQFFCTRLANIETAIDISIEVSDGEFKTTGGFKLLIGKSSKGGPVCGDKYCDFAYESCSTCEQDCNKCQQDYTKMQCGYNPTQECKPDVICPSGKTQYGSIGTCSSGKSFTCYNTKMGKCSEPPTCGPGEIAIRTVFCA